MKSDACMVILSGGQDSTTCLFWAKKHFKEVHAVSFDYGQKHRLELEAALRVVNLAGVASHKLVVLGRVLEGRSPLTNPSEQLEKYENAQQMEQVIGDRVELTFVPMRNALFMVLAANQAICRDINQLVAGVCQADNANYPDCRREYVDRMESAIVWALGLEKLPMRRDFVIHTPLMNMTKAESVKLALSLPGCYEALAWSHTSYDGTYPPTDNNHANILRADGFEKAGVPDPLVVRAWYEGLMQLPETVNYQQIRYSLAEYVDAPSKITAPLETVLAAGLKH